MKKTILLMLLILAVVCCVACGNTTSSDTDNASEQDSTAKEVENEIDYEVIGDGNVRIWEPFDNSDEKYAFAYVPIKNTGTKSFISVDGISIEIEDSDGSYVGRINSAGIVPNALDPGETGHIYYFGDVSAAKTGKNFNVKLDDDLRFVDVNGSESDGKNYTVLDYSDISYSNSGSDDFPNFVTLGRIVNNTEQSFEYAFCFASYYDSNDDYLGTTCGFVTDLDAGEAKGFEGYCQSIWDLGYESIPGLIPSNVKRYEVKAYGANSIE